MYKIVPKTPLACQPHDHNRYVSIALAEADVLHACQGVRLTGLRRRVLELAWQSYELLEAYDTLAALNETDGRRVVLPTVHRALDSLQENGLVYHIVSLNVLAGCNNPEHSHQGQFLIYRAHHTAIKLRQPDISRVIVTGANSIGFVVESQTVEVVGLCGTRWDQKGA